jgi:Protein of unknown function (DUF2853)
MSSKVEMLEKYVAQLEDMGETADSELLEKITDGLGPANYNLDAQAVSVTDPAEMKRVYTNFVADELAISDEEKGMAMVNAVGDKMAAAGIHKKYRAVFYYLLSKMV